MLLFLTKTYISDPLSLYFDGISFPTKCILVYGRFRWQEPDPYSYPISPVYQKRLYPLILALPVHVKYWTGGVRARPSANANCLAPGSNLLGAVCILLCDERRNRGVLTLFYVGSFFERTQMNYQLEFMKICWQYSYCRQLHMKTLFRSLFVIPIHVQRMRP